MGPPPKQLEAYSQARQVTCMKDDLKIKDIKLPEDTYNLLIVSYEIDIAKEKKTRFMFLYR